MKIKLIKNEGRCQPVTNHTLIPVWNKGKVGTMQNLGRSPTIFKHSPFQESKRSPQKNSEGIRKINNRLVQNFNFLYFPRAQQATRKKIGQKWRIQSCRGPRTSICNKQAYKSYVKALFGTREREGKCRK